MPMPLWWGQINKRVFNLRAVRNGKWQVIRHVGRSSGQRFRTPLEALTVDGGFIFMLVYGSRSDWVQNVIAAGMATLEIDGDTVDLIGPELISADEAFGGRLAPGGRRSAPLRASRADRRSLFTLPSSTRVRNPQGRSTLLDTHSGLLNLLQRGADRPPCRFHQRSPGTRPVLRPRRGLSSFHVG